MSALSLKCYLPSIPNQTHNNTITPTKAVILSTTTIPRAATLKHSQPSIHNSSTNHYRVSLKNRIRAKPTDSDVGVSEELKNDASINGGNSSSNTTSFLSVLCPLLRLFSGGDPSKERNYTLEVVTSSLSSLARLPWGSRSSSTPASSNSLETSPSKPLQLYEFEACPFCRRVREALTELDLLVEVYPCPKGSLRHREIVRRLGGKEQFPFLVDPNTGVTLYESGDIVKYLFQQYGKGGKPSAGLLESTLFTGWVPTILRAGRGMMLWEKASQDLPSKKLELFSYENNAYARIVREALCELELPYILHNVGAGSKRTKLLADVSGSQEVPYLIDPNTSAQIGDYKKILEYLFKTYATAAV